MSNWSHPIYLNPLSDESLQLNSLCKSYENTQLSQSYASAPCVERDFRVVISEFPNPLRKLYF
jgi:hypothetical protein